MVAAVSGNNEIFREMYAFFYIFEIEDYAHLSCLYFKISLAVQLALGRALNNERIKINEIHNDINQ